MRLFFLSFGVIMDRCLASTVSLIWLALWHSSVFGRIDGCKRNRIEYDDLKSLSLLTCR